MDMLPDLAPQWWWLIAGALLAILEIFLPGVFLVWIALAAAFTGLVQLVFPLPFAGQAIVFILSAFVAVFAGRFWYARNPVDSEDPGLNARASRLIGQVVTVETAIENGKGRVRVGDGVWNASGPDTPAGTSVRIVSADGALLAVELA